MKDDSEIITEFVRSSDPDLFEILIDRYKGRVHRLILSVLGPDCIPEAEEAAQDVFLQVFRQLKTFRMECQFGTWLYRIAYNMSIDIKRRARYSHPHTSDSVLNDMPSTENASDPFAAADTSERNMKLQYCMDRLPDLYRSVLYLYYWLGCDTVEIGNYLDMPAGTIKSHLFRARHELHARMKQNGLCYD